MGSVVVVLRIVLTRTAFALDLLHPFALAFTLFPLAPTGPVDYVHGGFKFCSATPPTVARRHPFALAFTLFPLAPTGPVDYVHGGFKFCSATPPTVARRYAASLARVGLADMVHVRNAQSLQNISDRVECILELRARTAVASAGHLRALAVASAHWLRSPPRTSCRLRVLAAYGY
ncbi:hypothetical protein FKP32DRAFT_1671303 [Trametes sanguinea]|nr:hypothetical protein FKP32DRAFT_1671303 [Trametes sanguinea]